MPLKFSANLSFLFKEQELINRFEAAKKYGFQAFEVAQPYELAPEVIVDKMQGMKCDLINSPNDVSVWGCASLPYAADEFCTTMEKIIPYKRSLMIRKLHILSGNRDLKFTSEEQKLALISCLNGLVEGDYLADDNVIGLIEPICSDVNPEYFLNSYETAVEILREVNNPNVKLLLDIFHLHKITGDVKKYLEIYYPYAGHIQVSQDPGRTEPFAPNGKIDYDFVFQFLQDKKHEDFIGLEYIPSGSTEDSLEWMKKFI